MKGLVLFYLFVAFLATMLTLMVLGVTVVIAKPLSFLIVLGCTFISMVVMPLVLYGYTWLRLRLSNKES